MKKFTKYPKHIVNAATAPKQKVTLDEAVQIVFDKLRSQLHFTSVEVDDEDPSFVSVRFYEDEAHNDFGEAEKLKECSAIKRELNRMSLRMYDEYEERYINYKINSIQYQGDSFDVFLEER